MNWASGLSWKHRVFLPRLTRPDAVLLGAVGALVALGLVMVLNAGYFRARDLYGDPYVFFRKQALAAVLGTAALIVLSRVRPDFLARGAGLLLGAAIVLLAAVWLPGIGVERGGARRWLCLPGLCFQPSELVKPALVIYLARYLAEHGDRVRASLRALGAPLVLTACCALLVLVQPDLGTAALLGLVALAMLYAGGARVSHVAAVAVAGLGAVTALIAWEPYRLQRITAFLAPWEHTQAGGFQLVQSFVAFGSGGWIGVGLGESRQKLYFLPEAHTDFIFATIGEELGFLGVLAVLAAFAAIAVRGLRIASRHPDRFCALLAFGITAQLTVAALVNASVALGLAPTKGLALPFISYGGSALMVALTEVGILAALSRMTG